MRVTLGVFAESLSGVPPRAALVSVRSRNPDSLVSEDPTFPTQCRAYWEGGEAGVWKGAFGERRVFLTKGF